MILFTSIKVEVVNKRLKYRFHGQEKIVQWLTKKLKTVKKELECKISRSLK